MYNGFMIQNKDLKFHTLDIHEETETYTNKPEHGLCNNHETNDNWNEYMSASALSRSFQINKKSNSATNN